MFHFVVQEEGDGVGVVVVEGVKSGQALSGWIMEDDKDVEITAKSDIPIGHKVALVANYDNCRIDPHVADTHAAMVRYLQLEYYSSATRYSTSAFLRAKLGEALTRRHVSPQIFESGDDAAAFVGRHTVVAK